MQDGRSEKVSEALEKLVGKFMHITVGKRNLRCPFWMNYDPLYKSSQYFRYFALGGKRTPGQIERLVQERAEKEGLDLGKSTDYQIAVFFLRNGIGIDCSGFVYQCLRQVNKTLGGVDFKSRIINRKTKNVGIRKVGVLDLASSKNSIPIKGLENIRPGDYIIKGSSHSVIIIKKTKSLIKAAHSSNEIKESGVHSFNIKINKPKLHIFDQEWQEITSDGLPYLVSLKKSLRKSDGVRRLKIIDVLYK